MKDKLLQIRVDENFLSKIEYLRKINGFKTIAETVRKLLEKEYREEKEEYGSAVQEVINDLPSVYPEVPWISCSKALPKIGDRVIGTYKNSLFKNGPYVVRIMRREKKYWVGDDEHWFLYENILAWQPLPKPYHNS